MQLNSTTTTMIEILMFMTRGNKMLLKKAHVCSDLFFRHQSCMLPQGTFKKGRSLDWARERNVLAPEHIHKIFCTQLLSLQDFFQFGSSNV